MTTPAYLLRTALTADPARPAVTFYDDGTGERVELSVTTLDNWVAKTANLLVDGLGAHAGGTVGLRLPCHWLAPVWLLAAWSAGQTVALGDEAGDADVLVVGPDDVEAAAGSAAGDVVALSLLPMARPSATPLPGRVVGYEAEVLGHGDRFVSPVPAEATAPALVAHGTTWTAAELVALAEERRQQLHLGATDRVLLTAAPDSVEALVDLALLPLVTGGVVLCRRVDPGRLAARATQERAALLGG